MERLTVPEPFEGRFRPHINYGGQLFWCMFDYAVLPVPEIAMLEVALAEGVDSESVKWFPHLHSGMLRAHELTRDKGQEFVGIRVEVRKILSHPINTTACGCERYGYSFIVDLVRNWCVTVPK